MSPRFSPSLFVATLCALGAAALAQSTPATKADAAKTGRKSAQAAAVEALNLKKLDERSQSKLQETLRQLEEVARKYEASEREAKRLNGAALKDLKDVKDPKEAKEKLEKLKDSLEPEDRSAVEDLVKELKKTEEELKEEAKKKIAEEKKKAAERNASAKAKPRPEPSDPVQKPAVTFDQVPPAPTPKAPSAGEQLKGRKVIKPNEFIRAREIIAPGNRDPKNPDRVLPESDPRTRTYYLKGNVQVRTENFAQDSDELIIILPPGSSGLSGVSGEDGEAAARPAPKAKKGDPVRNSAGPIDEDGPQVERMIATGNVKVIRRDANGAIQTGAGGVMIYDGKTGDVLIKDWPEAQDGKAAFLPTRQSSEIIMNKNKGMVSKWCDVVPINEAKGRAKKLPTENSGPTLPARPAPAASR